METSVIKKPKGNEKTLKAANMAHVNRDAEARKWGQENKVGTQPATFKEITRNSKRS